MVPVTVSGQPLRAIGYLRVSTDEQTRSGAGLEAQRARILAEAERRGWNLEWVTDDGYSAGDLKRPGIEATLMRLAREEADVLVASKLDRLSRSVLDFAGLLERSQDEGWGLVLLDLDLDTTKPAGRLVAHVMAAVAAFERDRISERTREALAAVKARGVRLGRPPVIPDEVAARIRHEREAGATLQAIAGRLTAEGVPTAHGARQWWPSTVRSIATN